MITAFIFTEYDISISLINTVNYIYVCTMYIHILYYLNIKKDIQVYKILYAYDVMRVVSLCFIYRIVFFLLESSYSHILSI